MSSVLFVCTGNIFRSLTAEHALRAALPSSSNLTVSSAGTADFPYEVRANVREYLRHKGFDVSAHKRRTLTEEILRGSRLVVAMSTDHQRHIGEKFAMRAPVFLEACGLEAAALPDIEEVVLDHQTNQAAVDAHVRMTIDRIIELAPRLAARIDHLLKP
jgi:protein-tyrosine phosphatase